jgi:hypothetical protein
MTAKLDTSIPAKKMAVHLLRRSNCARNVCVLQQNGVVVGHLHATHTTLAKNMFPDLFIYRGRMQPPCHIEGFATMAL